jgi:ACS family D-galactonate transporter-like MFS transporter
MPSRSVLFTQLALVIVNTKMIRSSLPPLVPFIASDVGYSSIQQASLLGAFFPGYLLTQLPAGWLAQRFGAKLVLSLNMFGTAVLYSLLPMAARSSSSTLPVAGLLTTMGLCQGGLIPAEAAINREWLTGMDPTGRAWMIRVLGFAHQACHLIATCGSPRAAPLFIHLHCCH